MSGYLRKKIACRNDRNWEDEWWAPVHATFILGRIGGQVAVTPLLMALRAADKHDCDWVLESLPAIFGKIGIIMRDELEAFTRDRSNFWSVRVCALEGLAAITISSPRDARKIFDHIASFLKDHDEPLSVRGLAGTILLDFQQAL